MLLALPPTAAQQQHSMQHSMQGHSQPPRQQRTERGLACGAMRAKMRSEAPGCAANSLNSASSSRLHITEKPTIGVRLADTVAPKTINGLGEACSRQAGRR